MDRLSPGLEGRTEPWALATAHPHRSAPRQVQGGPCKYLWVRFTKRADLVVDGVHDDDRWRLAVDLIDGPEQRFVMVGELLICKEGAELGRVGSRLIIEVDAFGWWVPGLDVSDRDRQGRAAMDAAVAKVQALAAADERFAEVLLRRGAGYELVSDYETGAVKLATLDSDGSLNWESTT